MTDLLTRPGDTDPPPTRTLDDRRALADDRRVLEAAVRVHDRMHVNAHLADRNHCGSPCRAAHVPAPYVADGVAVVEVDRATHSGLLDDVFVGRLEVARGVTVDRSASVVAVFVYPYGRGDSPI